MIDLSFLPAALSEGVTAGCFPSATCVVGMRDEVLFTGACGGADLGTRFDLASLSKVVSTTMIALCALEEGVLTLDDRLAMFFDAPRDKEDITVRQLMTHTGGFTPAFWLFKETDHPSDVAGCILRHPLEAPPDGTPRYSCMGYILLGKLLERALGAPLDALAQRWVFGPLTMAHTGYNPQGGNIAPTEFDLDAGMALCGVVHDENARFMGGVSGNAGVFSDITDMTRFASMLAQSGLDYLSPATLAQATRNYTSGHDAHRGLGFQIGGLPGSFMGDLFPDDAFGHTGFTGTSLVVDPTTGLYVVLLSNRVHPTRANDKLFRFRRVLHNRVYAAVKRG